jgi:collagenase-like PrtC family protease
VGAQVTPVSTPQDDDLNSLIAWLDRFQGFRPDAVELADPAAAAAAAAQVAREAAAGLSFDADPAGFTRLLESLARTPDIP